MKENPFTQFSYQSLKALEKLYREDVKDSTLTPRKQANAKIKLELVREAMRLK